MTKVITWSQEIEELMEEYSLLLQVDQQDMPTITQVCSIDNRSGFFIDVPNEFNRSSPSSYHMSPWTHRQGHQKCSKKHKGKQKESEKEGKERMERWAKQQGIFELYTSIFVCVCERVLVLPPHPFFSSFEAAAWVISPCLKRKTSVLLQQSSHRDSVAFPLTKYQKACSCLLLLRHTGLPAFSLASPTSHPILVSFGKSFIISVHEGSSFKNATPKCHKCYANSVSFQVQVYNRNEVTLNRYHRL